jgi:dienelactone hydrolase
MRLGSFLLLFFSVMSNAQQTITFPSSDGLTVTADLYLQDKALPFIILYHQAVSSRGEFNEIAPKLQKLGYNCLAVDLRSGKESNFVQNETAARAVEKGLPTSFLDTEKDMLAAIEYVKKYDKRGKCILFGSSYSASLVLRAGQNNKSVKAIVAFSPGEYFQPQLTLKSTLINLDKPIFIAATNREKPFVKDMMSNTLDSYITWWFPTKGSGVHAAHALWDSSPESSDCWTALLIFFKNLKK